MNIVELNNNGLYCAAGDFYIDPWRPVRHTVITHGHSDHARIGGEQYYCSLSSEPILRHRLGQDILVNSYSYGERFKMKEAFVSLHPAGHVLGSAQVRIEVNGQVWVVSGDYKRSVDASCEPFQVVPCDVFI